MGVLSNFEALFHPGGNPEEIFAAAAATRSLASGLRDTAMSLDMTAADLEKSWHGIGGGAQETAAEKFQTAWGKFSTAIVDYAGLLDTQAEAIQKQGEALQQLQAQAVNLDWIAGLTGVFLVGSVAFDIATGGLGAAAEYEIAANRLAVAAEVMTQMEAVIANTVIRLVAVLDIATPVATQFVLGAVADGAALVWEKVLDHQNPLSWASWTPDDLSNIGLGGLVSGVAGILWNKVGALAAFQDAHPVWGSAFWNASAAFVWAVPWEFWIKGQSPLDLKTWAAMFESAGVSLASAPVYKWLGKVVPILGRVLNNDGPSPIQGVTWADISNNIISVPVSGEKLKLITGEPPFLIPPSAAAPASLPGVPVPNLPKPATVPPIPPHVGGGIHTVEQGDNLYDISERTLGNPNLYPVLQAANPLKVGANGNIVPGQKLLIPVLPPVPHGSTAQVVQPGQSVSDFAGGNPQFEQQIAELNGLKNINLIYPGQVLIVPPAS